jgi:L-amino acid N-acyltransferase YncA
MTTTIRPATPDDAEGVARVLNGVIAEGDYTIFDRAFSVEEERAFLSALGQRGVVHVAVIDGAIAGVQSVGRFSTMSDALGHVATMGTWIAPSHRGHGLGRALAAASFQFAAEHGYEKILIYVLADNDRALAFYASLGFTVIGIARKHVRLGGVLKDEVFLEVDLQACASKPPSPKPPLLSS